MTFEEKLKVIENRQDNIQVLVGELCNFKHSIELGRQKDDAWAFRELTEINNKMQIQVLKIAGLENLYNELQKNLDTMGLSVGKMEKMIKDLHKNGNNKTKNKK